ncbi:MAG: tetratricopeptide repeat protein [Bacteroidales bacterium]|nr:tetratricopeptide repeat protein [Bacteroidales bacterium]
MNKVILCVAALSFATATFAQKAKVNSAENACILGQMDRAKQDIDEALVNPKTEGLVKTYLVASRVYSKLAAEGKDDEGVVKGRQYLEKAVELDQIPDKKGKTGKEAKAIAKEYTQFSNNSVNYGVKCFNDQNFSGAKTAFLNAVWANSHAENYKEVNDSVLIYNAAIAAMQAEDYETAATCFEKSAEVDYDGPMSILRANYCYQQLKAPADRIEANLKKGFVKYPDNKDVLTTLIQYYLTEQRNEEALAYLNEAIAKDPTNARYYFARGCLNEKINMEDAIKDYETAIAKDDKLFNAYYNLAVVHYNKGVERVADANNERDQKKYEAIMKEANAIFEKSLPYMESAADNADTVENKKQCLETIKSIYYRLGKYDKSQEAVDRINAL